LRWAELLAGLPLIAILRGVRPEEATDIGHALLDAGFGCVEVPLNSPGPLVSIERLSGALGDQMLIGAGTVLTVQDVAAAAGAGARLIVSPNTDLAVIAAAKAAGLVSVPAFLTPSEAFAALAAGADGLKLFPAEAAPPKVLKAMKAVLPPDAPVFPVGGIDPETMQAYRATGAAGFGIGGALYRPGDTPERVHANAKAFVAAWRSLLP
jgi:2-dehydro-3-deoxyphosphogalactonate aldolase